MTNGYNCYLCCYNSQDNIQKVIDSIFNQTVKPSNVFVFDDNSKDDTALILEQLHQRYPDLHIMTSKKEHKYDTSRLPSNFNRLLELSESMDKRNTEYELIMSDDIILTKNYVERLLSHIKEHPEMMIISGNEIAKTNYKYPRGAGRLINLQYFNESQFKGRYKDDISFESALIFDTIRMGYSVACINEIKFIHARKNGQLHGFKNHAQTMKNLGYSPLYVLSRSVMNLVTAKEYPRLTALKLIWKYIHTKDSMVYDADFKKFVSSSQNRELFKIAKNLIVSRFTIILYAMVLLFGVSKF